MSGEDGGRSGGQVDEPPRVDLPGPDWRWRQRLHAWRERLRANAATRKVYRWVVGGVGLVVVIVGLIMVPFPGPGWLIVFIGVAIWASEFHWARRLLTVGRRLLSRWTDWMLRQGWVVRALVTLATIAVVVAMFWVLFKVMGVPGWLPDIAQGSLRTYGRL